MRIEHAIVKEAKMAKKFEELAGNYDLERAEELGAYHRQLEMWLRELRAIKETERIEQITRHFGLTGEVVRLEMMDRDWGIQEVPVKLLAEYPTYLLGEVIPHYNPAGSGESHPYKITISKYDLFTGEAVMRCGKLKRSKTWQQLEKENEKLKQREDLRRLFF